MSNSTTETIDLGSVIICAGICDDDLLTVAGAGTIKAGTILARDSSTQKLVPFVKGGSTNGNGIPVAVLTYAVEAEGSGDVPVRALFQGHVNRERLIINADGDGSNVDNIVCDELRSFSIIPQHVNQLASIPGPEDS